MGKMMGQNDNFESILKSWFCYFCPDLLECDFITKKCTSNKVTIVFYQKIQNFLTFFSFNVHKDAFELGIIRTLSCILHVCKVCWWNMFHVSCTWFYFLCSSHQNVFHHEIWRICMCAFFRNFFLKLVKFIFDFFFKNLVSWSRVSKIITLNSLTTLVLILHHSDITPPLYSNQFKMRKGKIEQE